MPISYMHQREILVSLFWVFIALTRESCQGWQTQPGVQFVGSCAASQPACQCWTCSYVCLALPPGRQHSPIRQCFREVECQSKLRPSVGCLSQFSPFAHKVSAVFFFLFFFCQLYIYFYTVLVVHKIRREMCFPIFPSSRGQMYFITAALFNKLNYPLYMCFVTHICFVICLFLYLLCKHLMGPHQKYPLFMTQKKHNYSSFPTFFPLPLFLHFLLFLSLFFLLFFLFFLFPHEY